MISKGSESSERSRLHQVVFDEVRTLAVLNERLGHVFATRNQLVPTDLAALIAVMAAEEQGEPLTAGALRRRLNVTSGAVTAILDRLENLGHVNRRRDQTDRRRVLLHHGVAGRRVAQTFFGPLAQQAEQAMSDFTDDELRTVHRFLVATNAITEQSLDRLANNPPPPSRPPEQP